jgi:hypothetical protein
VVDLVQCSLAIELTPLALGLAWVLISGIGNSPGRGMNPSGRGYTRLNDRRAREGSSAKHAALRRTPTRGSTQTRDRERSGQRMKTILCPVPGGFNFTA